MVKHRTTAALSFSLLVFAKRSFSISAFRETNVETL